MDKQQDIVEVMARAIEQRSREPKWTLYDGIRAALTALEQAGYAVVPVEPTEEMAAVGTIAFHDSYTRAPIARAVYAAMLSARPSPLKIE